MSNPDLRNIGELYKSGRFDDVVAQARPYLRRNQDCAQGWNFLALAYRMLGDTDKSEYLFTQLISKNPLNIAFKTNLANLYLNQGKTSRSIDLYREVLDIFPRDVNSLNGLGLGYVHLNNLAQAKIQYEKILRIAPDNHEGRYQLANIQRKYGDYAHAAELFKGLSDLKSRVHRLDCLYYARDIDQFTGECIKLVAEGQRSPLLGCLIQHANSEHGLGISNPFCDASMEYVLHEDLAELGLLTQNLKDKILEHHARARDYSGQPLLSNGKQTSGNIFNYPDQFLKELYQALQQFVERYRVNFKGSGQGFLDHFPKDYRLYGWLVDIESGGHLKPHIHKEGWLSAAFYLKVPKVKGTEAGIEFSYHGADYPVKQRKHPSMIKNIREGEICMFPSSLFHRTKPFSGEGARISFAFDVIPRDLSDFHQKTERPREKVD